MQFRGENRLIIAVSEEMLHLAHKFLVKKLSCILFQFIIEITILIF